MFTKKLRNISMVALALVMSICLGFGLSNVSQVKQANAATVEYDTENPAVRAKMNDWHSDSTIDMPSSSGNKMVSLSFNSTGFLDKTEGVTDYVTFTIPSDGSYIKYNYNSSTLQSGNLYGLTANSTVDAEYTISFVASKNSKVYLLVGTDSNNMSSSASVSLTGNTEDTVTFLPSSSEDYTYTIGTDEYKLKVKARYAEFEIKKGTTTLTFNPKVLTGGTSKRKFLLYDVLVAPEKNTTTYAVTTAVNDENMGTVSASTTAAAGDTVTLTATPKTDCIFEGWTITKENGDATDVKITNNTFTMPEYAVKVTANFKADDRVYVTALDSIANVFVKQGETVPLGNKLSGTAGGNKVTNIDVEWDKAFDTSKAGTTTYTATAKEGTYKVNGTVTVSVNVTVKAVYSSKFSAHWDIVDIPTGQSWDGTSDGTDAITERKLIANAMGIKIYAAAGTFSDEKSFHGVIDGQQVDVDSSVDNCIKADVPTIANNAVSEGKALVEVDLPEGFTGTITVKASTYNNSNGTRWAKLQLVDSSEKVIGTVDSKGTAGDASNYNILAQDFTKNSNAQDAGVGKTETNYYKKLDDNTLTKTKGTKDNGISTTKEGGYYEITDAELQAGQYDFVFNIDTPVKAGGETFTVKNITMVQTVKNGKTTTTGHTVYASKVTVNGESESAKRNFVAGEVLPDITEPREGYTFIGWTKVGATQDDFVPVGTEITTENEGDYFAVFAKVEYLGVAFFTSGEAKVRYGFLLKFYDHDDSADAVNSIKTQDLINLQISMKSATFNATVNGTLKPFTFDSTNGLKYAYNDERFGYVCNLVLAGVTPENATASIKVDAALVITVHGKDITLNAEGEAAATIASKAQTAYDQGAFGNKDLAEVKEQAQKYGVNVG